MSIVIFILLACFYFSFQKKFDSHLVILNDILE